MSNLVADADGRTAALSDGGPFDAADARQSRISRHLRRNARRKRRVRVLKHIGLAVVVSAAAFLVLQVIAYNEIP